MNQIDLNHRHAVITGGAQGLGFSVAARLLASGASVSLWDRDAEVLKLAFGQLQGHGAVSIETVDVSQADSVMAATEKTIHKLSKIDILVASAGIAGPNFKSWEYPLEAWKQVIDINLTGVFLCCRAIVPHMLRQNYGRIVNISSIAGKEGNPTASGYSASQGWSHRLYKIAWQRDRPQQYRSELHHSRRRKDTSLRSNHPGTY